MSKASRSNTKLLSPEYWGDHDIFDEAAFINAPATKPLYIDIPEEYKQAQDYLEQGLGQIALGGSKGIKTRYNSGDIFDPDLMIGSLVVIDEETLSKFLYNEPGHEWRDRTILKSEHPIARPYSEYWLRGQDGSVDSNYVGLEEVVFPESYVDYKRVLKWGVVTTKDSKRVVQPFRFFETKLQGGKVITPDFIDDYHLHSEYLSIPINAGETLVNKRCKLLHSVLDSLTRIRSIDVVYAAPENVDYDEHKKGFKLPKIYLKLPR